METKQLTKADVIFILRDEALRHKALGVSLAYAADVLEGKTQETKAAEEVRAKRRLPTTSCGDLF